MIKKLLFVLLLVAATASAQVTGRIPRTDTNNTWTGANTFGAVTLGAITGTSETLSGSATFGSIPSPGPIGGTTPNTGAFTTLSASGAATFGSIPTPGPIGGTTPNTGAFTNLTASGTLGVTGAATFGSIPTPGAIGGTTPSTGAFTTVTTSSVIGSSTLDFKISTTQLELILASVHRLGSGYLWGFSSATAPGGGSLDVTLCRLSAGVLQLNNAEACGAGGTLKLSGLFFNGDSTMSASPRMTWSGFAPTLPGSTVAFARWTNEKAITVTSIEYQATTTASGCATRPVITLQDNTTPAAVTTITLVNATAGASTTGLSVNVAAGKLLSFTITTQPSGCTGSWANINFTIQYKMQ